MKSKFWIILAALALIGGVFFLGVAGKYYLSYLVDTDANPLRHEYLIGVVLSVMISIPFWVAASGFIYPVRAMVPKLLLWGINVTTGVVVGFFVFANIAPLFMMLVDK